MRDLLHFAFEYLDRGWPVLPVLGKTPAIPWQAYQTQRPTLDKVREWFLSNEGYGLAIVTGSLSQLVVIDCDSVADACWWQECYPTTPLVAYSGGGGTHFYYRYPDDERVGNRTRILDRRIDVRGEGGLVVAPPSIHPQTGQAYRWKPWGHYALEEIPQLNVQWLGENSSISVPKGTARPEGTAIQDGMAYIRRIKAVSGSGGHNATFRAACKLRDSGMTAEEALESLSKWNVTNAQPPWSRKELAHKVEDAYRLD